MEYFFLQMGLGQVSLLPWLRVERALHQLQRRGITLANRCCLCGDGEEIVDHLLIHCSKTRIRWEFPLAIFGVRWVFSLYVNDTHLSLKGSFVGKRCKKALMAAPLCMY